jgi:small subunit ribosomal protein S8
MVNNSLAFMFSVINSASISNQGNINVPTTKKCLKVLRVLYREGLIRGYTYNKYRTNIYIKFTGSTIKPVIKQIQPISTNGRPIFVSVKTLAKLAHANEIFIISTIKGILTLKESLQQNVGGVLFCKII